MIVVIAALCLSGTPGIQGKTLLEQVCPQPTGKNGYEEYLRAADVVNNPEARLYLEWTPGKSREMEALSRKTVEIGGVRERANPEIDALLPLARRLEAMNLLEVRREAVKRFGAALALVRQGNKKPVHDPRENLNFSSLFPELSQFRNLARLAVADAYVKDADGQGPQATETLIQAMTMAYNAGRSTLISALVGFAQEALILSCIEDRLRHLSQPEADRIAAFVGDRLGMPVSVATAMRNEALFASDNVRELLDRPDFFLGPSDEQGKALAMRLRSLSSTERRSIVERTRSLLKQTYAPILARFEGPESEWVLPSVEPRRLDATGGAEEIADAIVGMIVPAYDSVGISAARLRTQLRLLRLAVRVIAFRWEHNQFPLKLEDAASEAEIADPLTGDRFQYTPLGDRFRVFSKGVPQTGEIDIRYQRPPNLTGPPPPWECADSSALSNEGPRHGFGLVRRDMKSADESAHSQVRKRR